MFSLERSQMKLIDVNPRSEIHGEEHKTAADLKFELKTSNDILSEFHPLLKSALFGPADGPQSELLPADPGHFPSLRFPLMGAIKWAKDFSGYTVRIHWGVSGHDDIVLDTCAIDGFRFECLDGGTVVVRFRVQAHPEPVPLGRLCSMIQQGVEVSLEPPPESGV